MLTGWELDCKGHVPRRAAAVRIGVSASDGHEGQHYLNSGTYTGQNLWRDEQSAGRTQLGIGKKIGFSDTESNYLENWVDDKNRSAMQQHMEQGYTY